MEERRFEIEPFTLMNDIMRNWWVILVGTAAAAMLAYVIAGITYTPQYTAKTTLVVRSELNSNVWNKLSYANDTTKTVETLIQSKVMKKIVEEKSGKEKMSAVIRTEVPEDTNILVLSVTDKKPQDAIDLLYEVMKCYEGISENIIDSSVVDVLAPPQMPLEPDNPLSKGGAAVKGALAGVVLLIMLIAFISCYRDTLKTEEHIEEKLDARSMGVIPFEKNEKTFVEYFSKKKKALLVNNPLAGFEFVEAYKKLAVKIDYQMAKENGQVLVVTSVAQNEGKSTVAANLAISLAEQSKKVLLIDGDLRHPSQFLIFGTTPSEKEEFGEALKSGRMDDILKKSNIQDLLLVLGKNSYSSSTEILRSKRLEDFLKQCRNYMDYVIIDSAPAGLLGDAEQLALYSDAVLFIVKQNEVKAEDINDVLDGFREHHSRVLGVVLNGVRNHSVVSGSGRYGDYRDYSKSKSRGK